MIRQREVISEIGEVSFYDEEFCFGEFDSIFFIFFSSLSKDFQRIDQFV